MLNQMVLVGKIKNIEGATNDSGEEIVNLAVAVPQAQKNKNGEYENDVLTCELSGSIAKNASEYLRMGDLVGIKGRLKNSNDNIKIVVEKLTFLSSKKEQSENEQER